MCPNSQVDDEVRFTLFSHTAWFLFGCCNLCYLNQSTFWHAELNTHSSLLCDLMRVFKVAWTLREHFHKQHVHMDIHPRLIRKRVLSPSLWIWVCTHARTQSRAQAKFNVCALGDDDMIVHRRWSAVQVKSMHSVETERKQTVQVYISRALEVYASVFQPECI